MLKRIMIFLTSILLLLNSALLNATTINGWFLSNPNAVGASILYDATKGSLTSSVLISPNASQVAKVLRGGVAGIALSFAVEQLLGAVDWVLDPANNQIKYKIGPADPLIPDIECEKFFYISEGTKKIQACNIQDACDQVILHANSLGNGYKYSFNGITGTLSGYCNVNMTNIRTGQIEPGGFPYLLITNPNYKYLSLITAAQQVIENAEVDNLDAQFAVLAAASNILSEAEQDDVKAKPIADELENNTKCPSGIVRNGSCWVCDKSLFMPYTRATRDAKTATRGKSCKNITDTTIKASNAVLFRNLINARVQENACWSPPDQNHATALVDAQNALSLCEN